MPLKRYEAHCRLHDWTGPARCVADLGADAAYLAALEDRLPHDACRLTSMVTALRGKWSAPYVPSSELHPVESMAASLVQVWG